MSEELCQSLKGCPVLVTADGEHFHQTCVTEVTPCGRYVRLESDGFSPGGLQRWRTVDSIQVLEAFASPTGPSITHGIVRLKNPATHKRPPAPLPPICPACSEASNMLDFPMQTALKSPVAQAAPCP